MFMDKWFVFFQNRIYIKRKSFAVLYFYLSDIKTERAKSKAYWKFYIRATSTETVPYHKISINWDT